MQQGRDSLPADSRISFQLCSLATAAAQAGRQSSTTSPHLGPPREALKSHTDPHSGRRLQVLWETVPFPNQIEDHVGDGGPAEENGSVVTGDIPFKGKYILANHFVRRHRAYKEQSSPPKDSSAPDKPTVCNLCFISGEHSVGVAGDRPTPHPL